MSADSIVLAVTGASGHLGRRVLHHLRQLHSGHIVALSRRPDLLADLASLEVEPRAGDFDDPAALKRAFGGIDRVLVVSTDAHDVPGRRTAQHRNAVRAAQLSNVQHLLYTSLTHCEPGSPMKIAPDHWDTEQALAASGLNYTVLRNNLYAELVLEFLPSALLTGYLFAAAGSGAVSWVPRDDVARAAAAALHLPPPRQVLDITGQAPIGYAALAALAAEAAGRPLAYQAVPADAMAAGMRRAGMPSHVAEVLLSFQLAAEKGDLAVCTSTVEYLTGQPPQPMAEFLRQHAAALRRVAT